MMLIMAEIAGWALNYGVYWTMENPATSLMWSHPAMMALHARDQVVEVVVRYC